MTTGRERAIEEISVDKIRGLLIRPKLDPGEDLRFLYRAACGVDWLEDLRAIGAREHRRWKSVELYQQIVAATKDEYGHILVLTPKTRWINVPSEFQNALESG